MTTKSKPMTKTYTETINEIAKEAVNSYFNEMMGGTLNSFSHNGLNDKCQVVSFIFGIDIGTVSLQTNNLIEEKLNDLKKNWHDAISGNYEIK